MDLDPNQIATLLPFEERYELRRQRWLDGPHGSWEAFDRVLEREVVVNVAWAYSNAPEFIRYAKVASSLTHPNFLPVYDLGITGGGTPFYTTAPLREMPLAVLLESVVGVFPGVGGFPILPIARTLRDACRALDYAHRRGLHHLQLRPNSLLIEGDYHVMFDVHGWAGVGTGGCESDRFRLLGNPAYMSPEQVNEAGPWLGPATDVFGMGGILHFILFGKPPNYLPESANPAQLIRAIAEGAFEPRRPGTVRPEVRSSLSRSQLNGLVVICLKALAHEPERRYPSATLLGDALEAWLGQAQRVSLSWPWRRKQPR